MFEATSKGESIGFVVAILAFLNTIQCTSFGTILERLSISYPHISHAKAENCTIFNSKRRCKFTTTKISFDSHNLLQLVLSEGGRTITCNKKLSIETNHWYGSCDGDADDANFIARFDSNGKKSIYGSIHVGDEICHIGPNINGGDEVLCIPQSDFQAEDDPILMPKEVRPENRRVLTSETAFGFVPVVDKKKSQRLLRGVRHHNSDRQLVDNTVVSIDVMVVWTELAECSKAGLLPGCTVTATTENMMRGLVDLAIAETNTAYVLSGIFTTLRLVHAYRDPDYVEGDDFYTSLEHITTPNDGFMDDVHTKRALYGADVVQMIAGATTSCGIGWSGNPSVDYMFAVTQYGCATGYYSFGHELGHNLGMFHDLGTEESCSETSTFNYGYRDPNSGFRTILSYDCKMSQCDKMPKDGCTRVQRFSNSDPAYTYNGKPIGDAQRNNAKQLNNVRYLVAAFFPAMNCQSDMECDDSNADTIDTCNTASSVCYFTVDEPIVQQQEGFVLYFLLQLFDRFESWLGFVRT